MGECCGLLESKSQPLNIDHKSQIYYWTESPSRHPNSQFLSGDTLARPPLHVWSYNTMVVVLLHNNDTGRGTDQPANGCRGSLNRDAMPVWNDNFLCRSEEWIGRRFWRRENWDLFGHHRTRYRCLFLLYFHYPVRIRMPRCGWWGQFRIYLLLWYHHIHFNSQLFISAWRLLYSWKSVHRYRFIRRAVALSVAE